MLSPSRARMSDAPPEHFFVFTRRRCLGLLQCLYHGAAAGLMEPKITFRHFLLSDQHSISVALYSPIEIFSLFSDRNILACCVCAAVLKLKYSLTLNLTSGLRATRHHSEIILFIVCLAEVANQGKIQKKGA